MSKQEWRKTVDGPNGPLTLRVDPPGGIGREWWHMIEEWADTDTVRDHGYTATRAEAKAAVRVALDAIWAASGKVRPAKREPLAAWHPDGDTGEWNLPSPGDPGMSAYVRRLPDGSWEGEYWGPPEVTFWKRSFITVDTAGLKRKAAMIAVEDAARVAGLALPGDAPVVAEAVKAEREPLTSWRRTGHTLDIDDPKNAGHAVARVGRNKSGDFWFSIWAKPDVKYTDYGDGFDAERAAQLAAEDAAAAHGIALPGSEPIRKPLAEWYSPVADHFLPWTGRTWENSGWVRQRDGRYEGHYWGGSGWIEVGAFPTVEAAMIAAEDAGRAAGAEMPPPVGAETVAAKADAPSTEASVDLSALRQDVLRVAAQIAGGAVADGGLRAGDDTWIALAALKIVRAVDDVCGAAS